MIRPIEVESREGFRLWLRYDDGAEGEVALSDFAGRGVFEAWMRPGVFESVRIAESGALEWPGGIDICGDALYMRLTDKSPEEVFPKLKSVRVDA